MERLVRKQTGLVNSMIDEAEGLLANGGLDEGSLEGVEGVGPPGPRRRHPLGWSEGGDPAQLFSLLGLTPDAEKGILVVGIDNPAMTPVTGATATIMDPMRRSSEAKSSPSTYSMER